MAAPWNRPSPRPSIGELPNHQVAHRVTLVARAVGQRFRPPHTNGLKRSGNVEPAGRSGECKKGKMENGERGKIERHASLFRLHTTAASLFCLFLSLLSIFPFLHSPFLPPYSEFLKSVRIGQRFRPPSPSLYRDSHHPHDVASGRLGNGGPAGDQFGQVRV